MRIPPAKFALGTQLAAAGEVKQAIELTREALPTEPLHANWYEWLASYLVISRDLIGSMKSSRRSAGRLRYSPVRRPLAVIETQRGNAQAALAAAQQEAPGGWQDIAQFESL